MEPENDEGNVEYKLRMTDTSSERIERLATQMRYRCDEGQSECIYHLGVEDDGTINGIFQRDYDLTMTALNSAAAKNSYCVQELSRTRVDDERYTYELLIREKNDKSYIDLTIAVAGSVDAGKSTLLGCLVSGKADDGRGSARLNVFNHMHEITTGRTSSISQHILGYDASGNVVNYSSVGGKMSWPEIVRRSSKVVTFYDLAGHEKYLKTTVLGLSGSRPDACLIVVSGNRGILRMTKEHMFLCNAFKIPFAIIVTKMDMADNCKDVFRETMNGIKSFVKTSPLRRTPLIVKKEEDVICAALHTRSESITPIFKISNVSQDGHEYVRKYLNLLQRGRNRANGDFVELRIDSVWTITGVGLVVGGQLLSGSVRTNSKLYIGPLQREYRQVTVRSIHCKRVPLQQVESGCYVCLGIKGVHKSDVRKGMMIVEKPEQHLFCTDLTARVKVLKCHSTTIRIGYEPMLHIANMRTSVRITNIRDKTSSRNESDEDNVLRTQDTAIVSLHLWQGPQYVKEADRIALCDGRTKIVGEIIDITSH